MLIQIAFLQRFSVYLGHPTYTFSIILFLMILSAGLGSLASERIDLERHRQLVWLPLGIAVAVLVETLLLQPVVDLTVGWGLPGRTLSWRPSWRRSPVRWATVFRSVCGSWAATPIA